MLSYLISGLLAVPLAFPISVLLRNLKQAVPLAFPISVLLRNLGMKTSMLIGFTLMGAGLVLQKFSEWPIIYPMMGYFIVNLGSMLPEACMSLILRDWFLESESLQTLAYMRAGGVIGNLSAFLVTYYIYLDIHSVPDKEKAVLRYSFLLKVYLALLLSTLVIIIGLLKSNPEGLEVTKRKIPSLLLKGSRLRSGSQSFMVNQHLSQELKELKEVNYETMATWNQLKAIVLDFYFLLFIIGLQMPIAMSLSSEMFLGLYMTNYKFDLVAHNNQVKNATNHYFMLFI